MFRSQLILILHTLTLTYLTSYVVELCKNDGVELEIAYVMNGQPVYVTCPLHYLLEENNFNVTWFKNGSQTEITSDRQTRVHQKQNYLKFIPAKVDDEGNYTCVLRNATYCIQRIKNIKVFKNDEGLCYTNNVMYSFEAFIRNSLQIHCPDMRNYVDFRKTQIKWFKECQPLAMDGDKYYVQENVLNIFNVTFEDSGIYTCEATFIYDGTDYKISRTIDYSIQDIPVYIEPQILYPTNQFIEVELGTAITIPCDVLFKGIVGLYWTFNNSFINTYSDDGRVVVGEMYTYIQDGKYKVAMDLSFSNITEYDYNKKFYCHIYSSTDRKAFVVLKPPEQPATILTP